MTTSDDRLADLRQFQRREFYKRGGFVVTGRLLTGIAGFIVIVLILALTFATTDDSGVGQVGGATFFKAQVQLNNTDCESCTVTGTFNEGDTVPFGFDEGDESWDFSNYTDLYQIVVVFEWDASTGSVDVGAPDVSMDTHTDVQEEQSGSASGFNGQLEITFTVNEQLNVENNTIYGYGNDEASLEASFYMAGERPSGTISYDDDNNPSPINDEPLDYRVYARLVTWDLYDLEVAETS